MNLSLSPLSTASAASPELMRHTLEQIISDLRVTARQLPPKKFAEALADAAQKFETQSLEARSGALNTSILKIEPERTEFDWIAEQYARLATVARGMVERMVDEHKLPPRERAKVLAYALLLSGHDSKWQQIVGNRSAAPTATHHHQLLSGACAEKIADTIVTVRIEGEEMETTVESLYARALLLERLASGNLNARQIEILDNWLIAWMRSLMILRTPPEQEGYFATDLDRAQGLTLPTRDKPTGARMVYLPFLPLLRQLDRAIERFHHGLIFPGFGLGMGFRIEEHLGVIGYLTREFALLTSRAAAKSPRAAVEPGREVAVYFGMNDIVSRAINTQEAMRVQADAARAAAANAAQTAAGSERFARTGTFTVFDPTRKILPVLDASESGLGLAASTAESEHIHVGDLAAVRLTATSPAILGTVSRKAKLARGNQQVIGINFLSRLARPLLLEFPAEGETTRPPASALFIPGEDASGRGDSIVASETVYRTQAAFRVKIGERQFRLTLGRVKQQGRGWKMCAFDVVGE